MQFMKNILSIRTLVLVIIILLPTIILAQPNNPTESDTAAPIDGGLSLLVAAGVGYGAKKVRAIKNKKNNL